MSSAKRLAREILDTRRLALGHATSPQLTSSAIDGGRLDINDGDGNRIGGLGLGDDGGFVIDYTGGPKPPKPSPPTVTADAGIFRVEWDGSFVNEGDEGILATSDTDRVEIHASMDENFVPDRVESFGGAFATLDGGSFALGPLPEAGTYYFRLVARSKSAQFSEPSDRVEQELAITSIDLEITDAWLTGEAAQNTADGKNSIWRGPDEPEADPDRPFKDGDIWFEMVDGKSIPNIWDETAGAWVANDDYRQSEIERVQQELRDELDTIIVDGSGTKNFYTPDIPTEGMREGDLWFDSSDDNKPYIFQGGEWVTVRDQFVKPSTSLNVTDWGMLQPNMKAIQGQWSNTGYQIELETSDDLGGQSLGVVNIPAGETGGGFITMPFQGVLSGSSSPEYSDDLFVNEGRPISIDLQLLYNGPFQPSASQRTLTAHYFADGELVDSRTIDYATLSLEVFPAAPDFNNPVAFYANLLGYQFGMRVTGTVLPTTVASVDEIALTVAIPLPAGAGAEKKLAVWSIDSRVQVPSTGLADGAVTETKVSDDAISTPKLQAGAIVAGKIAANAIETDHLDSKIVTTDKIATGAITAESGIIGSINAGTITVGEMDGARIKAGTIDADTVLVESSIGSTLIKDGAILTEHIKVGAITAESGIIGSIDANVITVGKIMGNQIDGDAINGKTITGAKIRTASSGSRVELTHNGLKQYNSLGATIVDMTAGSFTLQGGSITGSTIKTATSGSRVEITTQGLKQFNSSNEVIAEMVGGSMVMKGILEQQNTIARMRMGAMWADNSPGIIWSEGEFAGQSNPPAISTVAFSDTGPNEESGHALYVQGPNANSQAHLGNKWWRMRAYGDVDSKYGWMYQGVDFTNIQNNYTSTNMSWMTQNKDSSTIGNRVSSTRQASLNLNANSGERASLVRNTSASGGQWLNLTDTFNVLTWSHPTNSGSAYLRLEDRYAFLGSYDGAGDVVGFLRMDSTESVLSSYKRSMGIWGNQRMMLESSSDSTSAYMKSDMIYYRTYSGSANVYITGNKVLGRSTSSRRYKDNIETIPRERYEDALLSLDFRTWQAKAEIAEYEKFLAWREENPMCPTPERFMEVSDGGPGWEAGMIAEELYDAGLDFLVPLDHYGRPESVNYDRIGPALIPIVREQRERIEALESRLEALEAS